MKNAIKLIGVWAMLFVATLSTAKTPKPFEVTLIGEQKVKIEVTDFGHNYTVSISDAKGKRIYETNPLDLQHLVFTIDFKSQKEGAYQITIKDDQKMKTMPVVFENNRLALQSENQKITFFPKMLSEGNSLFVKMISSKDNDLQIDIENIEGRRIYSEEIDGKEGIIGKRFQFQPGEYIVTLSSNDYQSQSQLNIK